jgi:hypothetical protein
MQKNHSVNLEEEICLTNFLQFVIINQVLVLILDSQAGMSRSRTHNQGFLPLRNHPYRRSIAAKTIQCEFRRYFSEDSFLPWPIEYAV